MSSLALLLSAAAAALGLLLLALWLRRVRARDALMAPPKRKPKHLPPKELDRLTALVGRGGEAEVLRQLKSAGYGDAAARRLVWLMAKVAAADDEAAAGPSGGEG